MAAAKIQMIERTLDIIEVLAEEANGLNLTEIAQKVDLPKSTVYRILNALIDRNYVAKGSDNYRYKLALKIVNLASNMLYALDLRTEAYPCLQKLADETKQTVHLATWNEDTVVYLDKIEAYQRLPISSALGRAIPLYCTALGKVLTAYQSEERKQALAEKIEYVKYTEHTNTDPRLFLEELPKVRKNGYAIDHEENEAGICCAAAPVFNYNDKNIAAVSITGSKAYFESGDLHATIRTIQDVGMQISKRMGFQGDKAPV